MGVEVRVRAVSADDRGRVVPAAVLSIVSESGGRATATLGIARAEELANELSRVVEASRSEDDLRAVTRDALGLVRVFTDDPGGVAETVARMSRGELRSTVVTLLVLLQDAKRFRGAGAGGGGS